MKDASKIILNNWLAALVSTILICLTIALTVPLSAKYLWNQLESRMDREQQPHRYYRYDRYEVGKTKPFEKKTAEKTWVPDRRPEKKTGEEKKTEKVAP